MTTTELQFAFAITLAVVAIIAVIVSYAFHIVVSSRRLQEAQRLSSLVLRFSPALIVAIDGKGKVISFNQSIERLSGLSASEVVGQGADQFAFLPVLASNGRARSSSESGMGPTLFQSTTVIECPDGTQRLIEWQIGTALTERGEVESTIATGIDVTELNFTQERLKALTVNLSSAEEQERKRIAEELHDRIGETLIESTQHIEDLKEKLSAPDARRALDELGRNIQRFLKGARSLIFELIPPVLYDIGLAAAVDSFAAHCRKHYHIDVKMVDDGADKDLEPDVAAFAYKAVRELVLNVVRHAAADEAAIKLSRSGDDLQIVVEDNGSGFEHLPSVRNEKAQSLKGFGLFNIKTQAEYYGGSLTINEGREQGGSVCITVPLRVEPEHAHQHTFGRRPQHHPRQPASTY